MRIAINRILQFDRVLLSMIFFCILALITIITSYVFTKNFQSNNNTLTKQITEISSMTKGVIQMKSLVESRENKIGLSKSKGIVSAMEQILETLRLEAKVIKPLSKKKTNEFMEENAEIEIQDIDLNHIVNLLYKIYC
jgi:spore cortex formation protein SpoVR/YcgB (stage V sporulation)